VRGAREITITRRRAIGSYERTFRAARVVFRSSPIGRAREGDSGRRYLSARGISKRGWERRWEREKERRASGRLRPHAQSPPKPQRERFVVPLRESKEERDVGPRRERKGVHERARPRADPAPFEFAVIAARARRFPLPRDSRSDRISDRRWRSRDRDRSIARAPRVTVTAFRGECSECWCCRGAVEVHPTARGVLRATRSSGGAQKAVKIHRRPEMSESQGQCCCRGRNARDATRAPPPRLGRVRRVHAPSGAEGWPRSEGRAFGRVVRDGIDDWSVANDLRILRILSIVSLEERKPKRVSRRVVLSTSGEWNLERTNRILDSSPLPFSPRCRKYSAMVDKRCFSRRVIEE